MTTGSPGARSRSRGGVLGDRRGQRLTVAEDRLDRRHDLAVVHGVDGRPQLVAGAEAHLRGVAGAGLGGASAWSRKRRTARALSRRHRSTRSSSAPRVDVSTSMIGSKRSCWAASSGSLSRPARSRSAQLHQQLGADVAQVVHRFVEPPFGDAPALRAMAASTTRSRPRPRGGRSGPRGPSRRAVDGPVGQRSAERPDPADLAVGAEQRAERPAVRDALRRPARGRRARRRTARRAAPARAGRRRWVGAVPAVVGATKRQITQLLMQIELRF